MTQNLKNTEPMSRRPKVCQKQMYPDIDRGWAWIVLVASYLGVTLVSTTLYMSGVLYIALLDRYHEGETKTSLVGAVGVGVLCFSAPFAGVINNRFSCRLSIVVGGALTSVGFVLSAFAPSLDWMIVISGTFVDLGHGLSLSGQMYVVGFYFKKWRDVVISFAFLTIGVAMFFSAPLGLNLIGHYGLTATFIILACIEAHICVIGVICKPSSIENEVHAQKKSDRANKLTSITKTYLDLSLLKNVSYMCFLCSTVTWNFALTGVIMHLPNYMYVLGGSVRDIGYLLSSFSVANLVGRLSGTLTISKFHKTSIYVHVFVLAVTGLVSSLFPSYSKLGPGVYIFTIQVGMFTGWPNGMMAPLSLGFVGVAKLSEAYGLAYVFCGIGVSSGPVLIGYLYSVTGSYEYSFVATGGVLILGSIFGTGSVCSMQKQTTTEAFMEIVMIEDEKQTVVDMTINNSNENNVDKEIQKPLLNGAMDDRQVMFQRLNA